MKRLFMNYMLVMQFIFSAIGLALVGYFIGNRINPESNLPTTLTAIGLALGVVVGFVTLIKMIQSEERYERTTRH
jgi:membrane protein DedA with SNARE-associated domain